MADAAHFFGFGFTGARLGFTGFFGFGFTGILLPAISPPSLGCPAFQ